MVKYKCCKCLVEFHKKSNYLKHLNKKFDCGIKQKNENLNSIEVSNETLLCRILPNFAEIFQKKNGVNFLSDNASNNINICSSQNNDNIYDDIDDNDGENGENDENCKDDISASHNVNSENIIKINDNQNDFFCCLYCYKNFSLKGTLARHIRYNCKVKKDNDNEKEKIFKMLLQKDEQINILLKQNECLIQELTNIKKKSLSNKNSHNITNSNNTNTNNTNNIQNSNNNNNIVMFNFGKEDLGIIDKQLFVERVVNNRISGVKIPEEILKIIHFNPNYPQLSNIYISDINREKCMIWEDGEWKLSPVDKIPEVIDKVVEYSNGIETELREKYPNNKKFNDRLDTVNKYVSMNDTDYVEELKEDMETNKDLIKRCENFQKLTYDTFKTTLYNEGKNINKNKQK
jgi:hypothetical protein